MAFGVHRTIYWAEVGVIKSSMDDGSNITIVAEGLGNVTAIDVTRGKFDFLMTFMLTK